MENNEDTEDNDKNVKGSHYDSITSLTPVDQVVTGTGAMEEMSEYDQYSIDCYRVELDIALKIEDVWVGDRKSKNENKNDNIETLAEEEKGQFGFQERKKRLQIRILDIFRHI